MRHKLVHGRLEEAKESYLMLNKYNYEEWLLELTLLCTRKKAESDEERFAYLVKTLPTSYKRIVMGVYKDHEAEEKQRDQEMKVKRSLFDEAVMLLKASVAQRRKKDETDLMLLQENTKSVLKSFKIRNFKFDLEKYYARFDKTVTLLETIGVDMDKNYLLRIFANGCIEHRDLRTRGKIVPLESLTNYHELKIEYSSFLEAKELKQSGKAKKGFQGADNYHSARCSFCHKKGHCWKKHHHLKFPSTKTCGSKAEEKTTPTKSEPTFKYEAKGLMTSKNKVKNDNYFYVDFACTWTMTGSRE